MSIADRADPCISLQDIENGTAIDISDRGGAYMVTLQSGACLRLSPTAYQLLRLRANGMSAADIRAHMDADPAVTVEVLQDAYSRIDERIRRIETAFKPGMRGLWLRRQLLGSDTVERIAHALTGVFRGPAPALMLTTILVAALYITAVRHPVPTFSADYSVGFVLFVLTLLAHEFGHAAACVRYGVPPGEIGVGLYLVFPAFYANVTNVWRLKRWERVIVDAAGMYFQLIVGSIYAFGYAITSWAPLRVAAAGALMNCLFMLNPIFKFDGYWLLADALGVTNLAGQSSRFANRIRAWWRNEPQPQLPWPPSVTFVVCVYSVIAVTGWALFVFIVLPRVWRHVLVGYPAMAIAFIADVTAAPATVTVDRVGTFIAASFVVLTLSLALWRGVSRFWTEIVMRKLRRLWSQRGHKPAAAEDPGT